MFNTVNMGEKEIGFIKKQAEKLVQKMGFDPKIEVETLSKEDSKVIRVNIDVDTPSLLIGRDGSTLKSLEYLLRLLTFRNMLSKEKSKSKGKKDTREISLPLLILDIDNYRKRKEVFLKEVAQDALIKVRETKRFVMLKPMTGFERKIIHTELAPCGDISTESLGEEPNRRIVIRFKKD
ncbi:hypothetical protein COY23_04565 [bacterium (Candidatus Torokbacteria) CG_4_10_14_0_2_um_filter_35_8]|nr:MAG: hypothetical protein COY23_04565 [bacterium (Candidatus Torokbacteria) CG_4_10_14_0_2_um_filter_35_8]